MKPHVQKTRLLQSFSLILNILNVVFVAYAMSMFFTGYVTNTNMDVAGKYAFRFFTNLSNIFCAVTSLFVIPFAYKAVLTGKDDTPKWVTILKFTGTTAVTVTFLTVVLFLGPTQGYDIMFDGPCLWLHALCPIFAILSFAVCELKNDMKFVESLYGIIPTCLYAILYLVEVLILENWPDYYGFATVIPWYVSLIMMPIATFGFAVLLFFFKKGMKKLLVKPVKEHELTEEEQAKVKEIVEQIKQAELANKDNESTNENIVEENKGE